MADSLIEREPKFGDWLRGIYASERNPTRDGMYVRTVRRTGKFNPGTFYECTDGKGRFWMYPKQSVVALPNPTPNAAALRGLVVTDEMVDLAVNAWSDFAESIEWRIGWTGEAMRRALEAAIWKGVGDA